MLGVVCWTLGYRVTWCLDLFWVLNVNLLWNQYMYIRCIESFLLFGSLEPSVVMFFLNLNLFTLHIISLKNSLFAISGSVWDSWATWVETTQSRRPANTLVVELKSALRTTRWISSLQFGFSVWPIDFHLRNKTFIADLLIFRSSRIMYCTCQSYLYQSKRSSKWVLCCYWERELTSTRCVLPHRKIHMILAEVNAGQRSAPMYNSITYTLKSRLINQSSFLSQSSFFKLQYILLLPLVFSDHPETFIWICCRVHLRKICFAEF